MMTEHDPFDLEEAPLLFDPLEESLPPTPPIPALANFTPEQRAFDLLTLMTRPDVPCAREAAARFFAVPVAVLDAAFLARADELGECGVVGDPCACGGSAGGWSAEFTLKTSNVSQSWTRTRSGSEGLSSVPHVIPCDGVLRTVTASSSTGQTDTDAEWEWRLIRESDNAVVAAHSVTGLSGVTDWNVPVQRGEAYRLDVRRTNNDDEVNDALVTCFFDREV